MKKIRNFQMTVFPNSVSFVFVNLRVNYLAVRPALVNLIASIVNGSAVKDRSKVKKANWILRKINSWIFCLSYSGCAGIYSVYGIFSNICQEINLLPHKMQDRVQDAIAIFVRIMKALYHSKCAEKCLWLSYADFLKMEIRKTFVGSEIK